MAEHIAHCIHPPLKRPPERCRSCQKVRSCHLSKFKSQNTAISIGQCEQTLQETLDISLDGQIHGFQRKCSNQPNGPAICFLQDMSAESCGFAWLCCQGTHVSPAWAKLWHVAVPLHTPIHLSSAWALLKTPKDFRSTPPSQKKLYSDWLHTGWHLNSLVFYPPCRNARSKTGSSLSQTKWGCIALKYLRLMCQPSQALSILFQAISSKKFPNFGLTWRAGNLVVGSHGLGFATQRNLMPSCWTLLRFWSDLATIGREQKQYMKSVIKWYTVIYIYYVMF